MMLLSDGKVSLTFVKNFAIEPYRIHSIGGGISTINFKLRENKTLTSTHKVPFFAARSNIFF